MRQDEKPEVVDLGRYRKELKAKAEAKAKAKPPRRTAGGGEPLLGTRPRAGVILLLLGLTVLALWLLPLLPVLPVLRKLF